MPRQGKREYVIFKSVKLPVYPYINNGKDCYRFAFPDESVKGGWRYGTRASKKEAREAAHAKAVEIANGLLDLSTLTQDQAKLCRAFLEMKPTWEDVEALKRSREFSNISLKEATYLYIKHKSDEAGKETDYIIRQRTFLQRLSAFTENPAITALKAPQLNKWLESIKLSVKSRNEHRAALVSLWKWCEKQGHITPQGNYNEAQKTTTLKNLPTYSVETYTPDQMKILFKNVDKEFIAWLAITAFSGLRSGELRGKGKDPMTWIMIKEEQGVIDCPAHLSKNRKRKLIPILPTLQSWLNVIEDKDPDEKIVPYPPARGQTIKLGKLIGGWKHNALRHSYGSYRIASSKNIGATALEMDNSEAIIKKHYLESKSPSEADKYFSITPESIGFKSD